MKSFDAFKRCGAGLVVAAGLMTAATAAQAVIVSFDLTGSGGNLGNTEVFGPESGVSLTVQAFKNGGTGQSGNIHQNANGLGVNGSPEGGRLAGSEQLSFVFDPLNTQLLDGLVFERGQLDEHFLLLDAGGGLAEAFVVDGSDNSGPGSNSFQTFDFASLNLIGGFSIRGLPVNGDENNEGVRIAGLTVQTQTPVLLPTPVPAALPLMASIVIGAGFIARRRKAAA